MSDDKPQKGPPLPWMACIKLKDGESYCGRDVDERREYMFNNAAYAVRRYKNDPHLRACPECVKKCEAAGVGQTATLAPMATRGEKDNNR